MELSKLFPKRNIFKKDQLIQLAKKLSEIIISVDPSRPSLPSFKILVMAKIKVAF
jgi:hypothetical protein